MSTTPQTSDSPEPDRPVTSDTVVNSVEAGAKRRRGTVLAIVGAAAAVALCAGGAGVAIGAGMSATGSGAIAASGTQRIAIPGNYLPIAPNGGTGGYGSGTGGYGTFGGQSGTATTPSAAPAATDAQKIGVVTINSDLSYESARAAGTGIVLTSSGEILTNNHVIEGATSIKVTVESTGETYTAQVVGTDVVDDIAVLQLADASGLTPATIDNDPLAVSDAVTAVGNAEGTGNLVAASGTVTALGQNVTVGNKETGSSESLTGVIQVNADVVSGDSGGPLIDAQGEVTGVVTAATSGTADVTGYAIPIDTALSIAGQIQAGDASGNVAIGASAFLGVELATEQTAAGAVLGGVIQGLPAASAGLVAGDVITALDGTAVTTVEGLSAAMALHQPGDTVTLGYTDGAGAAQTTTVTLVAGPAA